MVWRLVLCACFGFLLAAKAWLIIVLSLPLYAFLLLSFPVAVMAALCQRGGVIIRRVAYLYSIILCLCGVLFIVMMASTFFGHAYDLVSPIVLALLGCMGAGTVVYLNKQSNSKTQH